MLVLNLVIQRADGGYILVTPGPEGKIKIAKDLDDVRRIVRDRIDETFLDKFGSEIA